MKRINPFVSVPNQHESVHKQHRIDFTNYDLASLYPQTVDITRITHENAHMYIYLDDHNIVLPAIILPSEKITPDSKIDQHVHNDDILKK